jgi:hypothetical protein
MDTESKGVVYVARGQTYLAEAVVSASSLKQQHPDLHVTLYADTETDAACFDAVHRIDPQTHPKLARQQVFCDLPYDCTLVLDSDTYICGDLLGLFQPMETFEFGAMPDPFRYRPEDEPVLGNFMARIPRSYSQLNAGVLLLRRTANVALLIRRWMENYARDLEQVRMMGFQHGWYQGIGDQSALREALYDTPLHWWSIPAEYNCILSLPGYVEGPVKILHGRHVFHEQAARQLNSILTPRVYVVKENVLVLVDDKGHARRFDLHPYRGSLGGQLRRLTHAVRTYGWRETGRRVGANLNASLGALRRSHPKENLRTPE